MSRGILPEFEDQAWFPGWLRQYMTDFLSCLLRIVHMYDPIVPVLARVMQQAQTDQVIDLCSGGGGPVADVQPQLQQLMNRPVHFVLTDKFPNTDAGEVFRGHNSIGYHPEPVDATDVPASLKGMRTVFSGFHHFDKHHATALIRDAVDAREALAIFDGGDKNVLIIIAILVFQPLLFVVLTPMLRPFSWRRLLFTYIIPLVPFCTVWDGTASILRLYQPKQMLALAHAADTDSVYHWEAGKLKNRWGMKIAYLVGWPK